MHSRVRVLDIAHTGLTNNGAKNLLSSLLELQLRDKLRSEAFLLDISGNSLDSELRNQILALCKSKREKIQ